MSIQRTMAGAFGAVVLSGCIGFGAAQAAGAASMLSRGLPQATPLYETVDYSPNDIRQILRKRGYDNIVFLDNALPAYHVSACRNNNRFHLRVNRLGEVTEKNEIGKCK